MPVWFPPRSMGTRSGISWLSALLTRSREVMVSFFGIDRCLVSGSGLHDGSLDRRRQVNQSQEAASPNHRRDGVVEWWASRNPPSPALFSVLRILLWGEHPLRNKQISLYTTMMKMPLFALVAALLLALGANTVRCADLTWTNSVSSDWNNLTNWTPQQVPTASDHVIINSGNVTIPADGAFAILDWTGGTIVGSLTVMSNAVLNLSGSSQKNLYAALTNANGGTINWSDTGNLTLYNNGGSPYNGSINNLAGGLFNIQNDQSLSLGSGSEYFNNAGTVRKSAGTGTTTVGVSFTNTGTVDAPQGTLNFNAGFTPASGELRFGLSSLTDYGKISENVRC